MVEGTAEALGVETNAKQASIRLTASMAKGTAFCGNLPLKKITFSFFLWWSICLYVPLCFCLSIQDAKSIPLTAKKVYKTVDN